ncbi:hypothetical protein CLV54_0732 [Compostimonas suwonensis]|uniref:Uncharacterized protein n=1 Tax=Compostimonas suwonensis TaxID=1048394 RepID=A0A2M9C591_9MICO|nr:hypothetical protein CLV54_0732 [Compostimonas suwonensis]
MPARPSLARRPNLNLNLNLKLKLKTTDFLPNLSVIGAKNVISGAFSVVLSGQAGE